MYVINVFNIFQIIYFYFSAKEPSRKRKAYEPVNAEHSRLAKHYLTYVGRTFIDVEDNIEFTITDVTINSSYKGTLFFEYSEGNNAEKEYSPCKEIISEEWTKWK